MKTYRSIKIFVVLSILMAGFINTTNAQLGKLKEKLKDITKEGNKPEGISGPGTSTFKEGDRVRCAIRLGISAYEEPDSWEFGVVSSIKTYENGDKVFFIMYDSYTGEETSSVRVKPADMTTAPLGDLTRLVIIKQLDHSYTEAERYGKDGDNSAALFRDKVDWMEKVLGNMAKLLTENITPGITIKIAGYREQLKKLKEKYHYKPKPRSSF